MWHLHENSSAVPGIGLATYSSTVVEIDQNGQCLTDNGMGSFSLHLAYEPDATGVVFKLWIVEALFFR